MKRQAIVQDKIFAALISDKGLLSSIYKDPPQTNNKEANHLIKMCKRFV